MKIITSILLLLVSTASFCQQFKISYTTADYKGPFSGKVFLYLNKDDKNPRNNDIGLFSFPCFSISVKNIQPGTTVVIDDGANSFPVKLSDIERGDYYVQAVWDRDLGGRAIGNSPGNIYNKTIKVNIDKSTSRVIDVKCEEIVPNPAFTETKFVKELRVPSALLSSFQKRAITIDAAILLPWQYYENPGKKFPVLFNVSGYGGDYHNYSGDTNSRRVGIDTIPCITVFLDGNCSLGHSVYANSDNNGPWGDALTKEFIPLLENKFRCNGARLLRGHSSGGWTVLWLQTQYPKIFNGCWSSSPDPVDFRDFSHVNLYKGENVFYDKDSILRSVATIAGKIPWASCKLAYQMENVISRGEQMHSFDAVFSAKGSNGNPESICDPLTGMMSKSAFEHWKKYDISLNLRNNWGILKNDLAGKIRISVGEQDNFFLNGPVHLLEAEMKKLSADMQFEYFPGDHFTVSTVEYKKKGFDFLAAKYKEWELKNGTKSNLK